MLSCRSSKGLHKHIGGYTGITPRKKTTYPLNLGQNVKILGLTPSAEGYYGNHNCRSRGSHMSCCRYSQVLYDHIGGYCGKTPNKKTTDLSSWVKMSKYWVSHQLRMAMTATTTLGKGGHICHVVGTVKYYTTTLVVILGKLQIRKLRTSQFGAKCQNIGPHPIFGWLLRQLQP